MDIMYKAGYEAGIKDMKAGAVYDFLHSTATENYVDLLRKRAKKLLQDREER